MADTQEAQHLRVVVIVGLAGSGKSTLAWHLSQQGWAVVQLGDDVDSAVYKAALLLQQGREVVVDGHMYTPASRLCWILMARAMNEAAQAGTGIASPDSDPGVIEAPAVEHAAWLAALERLLRLLGSFRLGIFTSSSPFTVSRVIPMLQAASQPSLSLDDQVPLFADPSLIFDRRHTQPAPAAHREAGGKDWDTVKPLCTLFRRLHRVLLIDDDAFKAVLLANGNHVSAKGVAGQRVAGRKQNGGAVLVTNMVMSEGVAPLDAFVGMSDSDEGEGM
ncbi:hypothetical protein WJX73_008427 [Symbiochloris irregularis]|uniref:Uncharacterized protein n=1 Tax=Symbiochloris irregularis TaxID=706552 RepID=A0AAW1PER0_9CHLO